MATTKQNLLFSRLRFARDPLDSETVAAHYREQLGRVMPYLEPGTKLPKQIEMKEMDSLARGWLTELDFSLSRLPDDPTLARIRKKLASDSPELAEEGFVELQNHSTKHPTLDGSFPALKIIRELPRGFGFYLKALSQDLQPHQAEETMRKIDLPLATTNARWSNNLLGIPVNHEIGLYFLLGNLYPYEVLKESYKGGHFDQRDIIPLDLQGLVRMYKAAEPIYGETWKKHDPEGERLMRETVARFEWQEKNPLWTTDAERDGQENFKKLWQVLEVVARSPSFGGGMGSFSWTFFLKKLWDEEALLEERFKKVSFKDCDKSFAQDDAIFDYDKSFAQDDAILNDPRFASTLQAMGEKLADWMPKGEEPRAGGPSTSSGQIGIARKLLKEHGAPAETAGNLREIFTKGLREIQWQDIVLKYKEQLQKKFQEPGLFEKAQQFQEGWFRDFVLNEAWKNQEPKRTRERAEIYLKLMKRETAEGAKINRAPDLMNQYVREHYREGTIEDSRLSIAGWSEIDDQAPKFTEEELDVMEEERTRRVFGQANGLDERYINQLGRNDYFLVKGDKSVNLTEKHEARKIRFQKRAEEGKNFPGTKGLYLFSDAGSRQPNQEVVSDKSFAARFVSRFANQDIKQIKEKISAGTDYQSTVDRLEKWTTTHLRDASLLKDFYLENALHLRLWNYLRQSRLGPNLEKLGIRLAVTDVDLENHFKGKDDGVLQDAYFTKYTLFRVEGLAANIDVLMVEEKEALAALIHQLKKFFTPGAVEGYERIAVELEEDRLRGRYEELYRDALPRGRKPTPEEEAAARDRAFDHVFKEILVRFPFAGYSRDDLLERFALQFSSTLDHVRRVEESTYTYLVRHPAEEKEKGEKVAFAPVEAVKNYLAVFQDRESRAKILGWIFGGTLPDDRYLEGRSFHMNPDEERDVFWFMSKAERRAVLYNALMGSNGLFEIPVGQMNKLFPSSEEKIMMEFLEVFYQHNIATSLANEEQKVSMEPVLRTVFFEIFREYSSPRRVELFHAITERMREIRLKGKQLTVGQAIRLFLEQIGVVGIKAGQVLSEQRGLVSDDVRQELSSLRERAAPFSKFGVFTYLEEAGLLGAEGESPFHIAAVGECVGSASIKQVHRAQTVEGQHVVAKFERPTIEKNFEEDARVLEKVLEALRNQGTNVPEFLLPEIVDACRSEFDFGQEAFAQREMDAKLYARHAEIVLEGTVPAKRVRLDVPDLLYVLRKGEGKVENLQLMVDEEIRGLSLRDIEDWQAFTKTPPDDPERQKRFSEIRQRIESLYPENAPLIERDFASLSLDALRAQIALDLIAQITEDGIFHADAHAGNIMADLRLGAERVALIDFGSVGRSIEELSDRVVDHRPRFREFLQNLISLRMGTGDMKALGEIVNEYVKLEGFTAKTWAARIEEIHRAQPELASFFKALLSEIVAEKGQINRQFKFLLKSLAAAGGHFESLTRYFIRCAMDARVRAEREKKPMREILLTYPGMEKLKPLIESGSFGI
ncbi:MAG: AarF/UbiB family protein [Candidatus Uhrbacteria bacterium]|nr:AarF/UbiB family protein [Candidatus Uhrbacteria bacterium]